MGRAHAAVRLAELTDWLKLEQAYGRSLTPAQVLAKLDQLGRKIGRRCAGCGRPAGTRTGTPVCCSMCAAGEAGHTHMCERRANAGTASRPAQRAA